MIRRLLFLLMLILLPSIALCDEPATLREARTIEEVSAFVLLPPEDGVVDAQPGYIRYIAQHRLTDPDCFRPEYWMGGPEGSVLDLTAQYKGYGIPHSFYTMNMCTRAVYSMALGYLGIDVTPGEMSTITGERNLDPPYASVTEHFGLELVEPNAHVFDTMVNNYLTDDHYSPIYVHIRKPDGQTHAFLVVAAMAQKSRFVVVDPSAMLIKGETHRVYMVSFDRLRSKIVNSTFRYELQDSKILNLYQWKRLD